MRNIYLGPERLGVGPGDLFTLGSGGEGMTLCALEWSTEGVVAAPLFADAGLASPGDWIPPLNRGDDPLREDRMVVAASLRVPVPRSLMATQPICNLGFAEEEEMFTGPATPEAATLHAELRGRLRALLSKCAEEPCYGAEADRLHKEEIAQLRARCKARRLGEILRRQGGLG